MASGDPHPRLGLRAHPRLGCVRIVALPSGPFSGRWTPTTSARPVETPGQADYPDLSRTPATRVFDALAAAWAYYSYGPLHERGAAYLARRGIDVAVLEAHTGRDEVGHTPASPRGLVTAMRVEGFADDELVDAGLAHRGADGCTSPTSTASES
jgi:hypothetical protein